MYLYLWQNVFQLWFVRVRHIWPAAGADENKNYLKLIFQPPQYLSYISQIGRKEEQARKLQATLEGCNPKLRPLTDLLTGVKCRVTSVAKNFSGQIKP